MTDLFHDLDAVIALDVQREEQRQPLQGVDAIAVRAIVALSRAGADLMTDASHARSRDTERLSKRARAELNEARELMAAFVASRQVAPGHHEVATCIGSDMDCGRPLPCPDHPAAVAPEPWHPYDSSDEGNHPRCDVCGEERRLHP